jgi:ABC-type multidrug transport system ATPase subunit
MHTKFKGECIYLAELDLHFPELTLGETLTFAASARATTLGHDPTEVARNAASLFYLDGAFDTKVGNAMVRGLSGGEKRRTSIAEAFISGAQLQCWDNSTRGLDSSTALRFIHLLRQCTDALKSTVVMSIYQASEDMYQRFDKVMLLYEGRQIYFGPVDAAVDYFIRLGFVRPSRATTADFLTSLTNPAERIVREGSEHTAPRTPDEFAEAWRTSEEARTLEREVSDFNADHPLWSDLAHSGREGDALSAEKESLK